MILEPENNQKSDELLPESTDRKEKTSNSKGVKVGMRGKYGWRT